MGLWPKLIVRGGKNNPSITDQDCELSGLAKLTDYFSASYVSQISIISSICHLIMVNYIKDSHGTSLI